MTNEIFNNSLSMSIAGSTTYFNYKKQILEASNNNSKINN